MKPQERQEDYYKNYREHTTGVDNDFKNIQQGFCTTAQSDTTGDYTREASGDEQGWVYVHYSGTARHEIGSWAQAVPAFHRASDGKIIPILNKSLAVDTDFAAKTSATSGNDYSLVRISGDDANGTPGILTQCLNDDSYELIFFPIGDARIRVDHLSGTNKSSKVFDIDATGNIDFTNVGTLQEIFRVDTNFTYLRTAVKFHDDGTKKGELNFETGSYPSITVPSSPANYEVKLVWDSEASKWKWYCVSEASALAVSYARIAWNFTLEKDLSEGELVSYDSATDSYTASGTMIWIDRYKCVTPFWTAGTNTIFEVRKIKENVAKAGKTRHLYSVTGVFEDRGYPITHLELSKKLAPNHLSGRLEGYLCSSEKTDPVYSDTSRILTTLNGLGRSNIMLVSVPKEWKTDKPDLPDAWKYTEVSDLSRGLPLWTRPIDPTVEDVTQKRYKSGVDKPGSKPPQPVAYYERVN